MLKSVDSVEDYKWTSILTSLDPLHGQDPRRTGAEMELLEHECVGTTPSVHCGFVANLDKVSGHGEWGDLSVTISLENFD